MQRLERVWLMVCCLLSTAEAHIYLGNYTGHAIEGRAITVRSGLSAVRFIFYRPDVLCQWRYGDLSPIVTKVGFV
ncbi:MAG: hypothetical protein ACE5H0_09625 [Bacteroidota bacterium]